jgi:hypothetical protein
MHRVIAFPQLSVYSVVLYITEVPAASILRLLSVGHATTGLLATVLHARWFRNPHSVAMKLFGRHLT